MGREGPSPAQSDVGLELGLLDQPQVIDAAGPEARTIRSTVPGVFFAERD